jgi:hypothetical protein
MLLGVAVTDGWLNYGDLELELCRPLIGTSREFAQSLRSLPFCTDKRGDVFHQRALSGVECECRPLRRLLQQNWQIERATETESVPTYAPWIGQGHFGKALEQQR